MTNNVNWMRYVPLSSDAPPPVLLLLRMNGWTEGLKNGWMEGEQTVLVYINVYGRKEERKKTDGEGKHGKIKTKGRKKDMEGRKEGNKMTEGKEEGRKTRMQERWTYRGRVK